jgi:hypothetical protein
MNSSFLTAAEPAASRAPDGKTIFNLPLEIRDLIYAFHFNSPELYFFRKPLFKGTNRDLLLVSR